MLKQTMISWVNLGGKNIEKKGCEYRLHTPRFLNQKKIIMYKLSNKKRGRPLRFEIYVKACLNIDRPFASPPDYSYRGVSDGYGLEIRKSIAYARPVKTSKESKVAKMSTIPYKFR